MILELKELYGDSIASEGMNEVAGLIAGDNIIVLERRNRRKNAG